MDLVREIDLPRVIVWDALIDPDLVSGWLAPAEIEPIAGGIYNLVWPHRPTYADTFGRISLLQHPERLHIDTSNLGRIEFSLESVEGGFRDTGTRLSVTLDLGTDGMEGVTPTARVGTDQILADWMPTSTSSRSCCTGGRRTGARGASSPRSIPTLTPWETRSLADPRRSEARDGPRRWRRGEGQKWPSLLAPARGTRLLG